MSTLYNQRGVWYLDTTFNNKRIRKSLHTTNYATAKKVARKAELEIRVDRFYGDEQKKKTSIDNTKRYYDISRDRMNFILQDGSL